MRTIARDDQLPAVRSSRGVGFALLVVASFLLAGCRTPRSLGAEVGDLGEGLASYYGAGLQGRPTASGERFDKAQLTAAHRTLPFGACVRVLSVSTGRSVNVRINDRGPFAGNRIIDVSEAAARELGLIAAGVGRVKLTRCRP